MVAGVIETIAAAGPDRVLDPGVVEVRHDAAAESDPIEPSTPSVLTISPHGAIGHNSRISCDGRAKSLMSTHIIEAAEEEANAALERVISC